MWRDRARRREKTIIGSWRLAALLAIVNSGREIRTGTRIDVSGDVKGLLFGELNRTVVRHCDVNERRRNDNVRHARADIVRSRSPERRSQGGSATVTCMASRAGSREHCQAAREISRARSETPQPLSFHFSADRNAV